MDREPTQQNRTQERVEYTLAKDKTDKWLAQHLRQKTEPSTFVALWWSNHLFQLRTELTLNVSVQNRKLEPLKDIDDKLVNPCHHLFSLHIFAKHALNAGFVCSGFQLFEQTPFGYQATCRACHELHFHPIGDVLSREYAKIRIQTKCYIPTTIVFPSGIFSFE